MKASKQLLISIFLLMLAVSQVSAQCQSGVKVIGSTADQALNRGKLILQVNASGGFHGSLVRFEGTKEVVVKEFSGYNNETLTLDDLDSRHQYRVKVVFENESEFLCKSKLIDDIELGVSK